MRAPDILPDSRLRDPSQGCVMADWKLPSGETVRVQVSPTYCANCGKSGPYVPSDNCHFLFYLCPKCFETHGAVAGTYAMPDEEFWETVEAEMVAHFGHALDARELAALAEQGWGPLANLVKDSPVKTGAR